jgi:hypothetical protein
MPVCLSRDRKLATATMTAVHVTVSRPSSRIENLGHKLYTDKFFVFSYIY